jgi:hypothetical protein
LDHFGSELVYILPTDRQKRAGLENFETLFAALDRHMGKLQICSYGLSDTTLEEVRNSIPAFEYFICISNFL